MSTLQDLFSNPEIFRVLGFLALVSLGVLFVLGLTDRVVVFNDGLDLGYCLGIFLVPVAAFFYLEAGAPHGDYAEAARNSYYASTSVNLTIWISLLLALGCAAATIVISITQNGLVIGLPISIFKILTTVLVLAVIAVYFFEKFRTKRRSIFETVVFGGLIGWIVSRLVNGERFRQRQSNTI